MAFDLQFLHYCVLRLHPGIEKRAVPIEKPVDNDLYTEVLRVLAFMRRADEGTLSRLIVEAAILLAASRQNGTSVLKDAATLYKVDTEVIGQKVKQEFEARARVKKEAKPVPKGKKVA